MQPEVKEWLNFAKMDLSSAQHWTKICRSNIFMVSKRNRKISGRYKSAASKSALFCNVLGYNLIVSISCFDKKRELVS